MTTTTTATRTRTTTPPKISAPYPSTMQFFLGMVTNNVDTENKGRIQVDFHNVQHHGKAWYEVMASNAGAGGGMHFTPAIGDTVVAGFTNNNANAIYILGAIHQGKEVSNHHYSDPNVFAIASRTQSALEFNDNEKKGSVKLHDNHSSIYMDGKDTMTIHAPKILNLLCGVDKDGKKTGIQINAETKTISIFGLHINIGNPNGNQAEDFSLKAKRVYIEEKSICVQASEEIKLMTQKGKTYIGGGDVYIA